MKTFSLMQDGFVTLSSDRFASLGKIVLVVDCSEKNRSQIKTLVTSSDISRNTTRRTSNQNQAENLFM